ncbi:MAG: DEAD/DEAH box helicase, partial [Gammaproteobacteria bacterium]|nr:DEAD/DEAH box helicase [Gammaproteobacteria bacterium]
EFISMKIDMQPVSGDLLAEVDPASRIRRERKPRPPHSRKKSAHKGGHNKGRRRPTGNQKASRN